MIWNKNKSIMAGVSSLVLAVGIAAHADITLCHWTGQKGSITEGKCTNIYSGGTIIGSKCSDDSAASNGVACVRHDEGNRTNWKTCLDGKKDYYKRSALDPMAACGEEIGGAACAQGAKKGDVEWPNTQACP